MIITLLLTFAIYSSAHAPTTIIIPAQQFIPPRYVAVGGSLYNALVHPTYASVWPHLLNPSGERYEQREVAGFLGTFYWVASFFLVFIVLTGGLLFLVLVIVRRQQERCVKRSQQNRLNV